MGTAANLPSLEQFFDHLSEGVLLFDRRAQVSFANTAALRRLSAVVGASVQEWQPVLGAPLVEWIAQAVGAAPGALRFPGYAAVRSVWPSRRNVESPPPPATLAEVSWKVASPTPAVSISAPICICARSRSSSTLRSSRTAMWRRWPLDVR